MAQISDKKSRQELILEYTRSESEKLMGELAPLRDLGFSMTIEKDMERDFFGFYRYEVYYLLIKGKMILAPIHHLNHHDGWWKKGLKYRCHGPLVWECPFATASSILKTFGAA